MLKADMTVIEAAITQGTVADAQWHSFSANKAHGLQRTNEDKEQAVRAALRHTKAAGLSDREIARHLGVHGTTVGKYRAEMVSSAEIQQIDTRTVSRGDSSYKQATANIGKSQKFKMPSIGKYRSETHRLLKFSSQPTGLATMAGDRRRHAAAPSGDASAQAPGAHAVGLAAAGQSQARRQGDVPAADWRLPPSAGARAMATARRDDRIGSASQFARGGRHAPSRQSPGCQCRVRILAWLVVYTPGRQAADAGRLAEAPRERLEQAITWARRQNVGIRTGRASGIIGIDVDPGGDVSPLNLPATATVSTGRPGAIHLYYRCREPIGNSSGKLGRHIDVKGDGGQLVYPGSVHPDTKVIYQWADGFEPWNVEIAELPRHVIDLLTSTEGKPARTSAPRNSPSRPDRYAASALRQEMAAVSASVKGARNAKLNEAAFKMGTLIGAGLLDRQGVEESLMQAAIACGHVAEDGETMARNTIRSGIEAGVQHPRTIQQESAEAPPRKPDHILTPGPHKTDKDSYIEQSSAMFAGQVLTQLPEDLIYRKDFIPGEILGQPGKRKWVEFGENRMRIVVDGHVRLGKWITSKAKQEQFLLYQACSKDSAGLVIACAAGPARSGTVLDGTVSGLWPRLRACAFRLA